MPLKNLKIRKFRFLKDMSQVGEVKKKKRKLIVYVLLHHTESIFFGLHTISFLEYSSLFQNFMELKKWGNLSKHSRDVLKIICEVNIHGEV